MPRYLAPLALTLFAPAMAQAGPPTDVQVQLIGPGPVLVNTSGRYQVLVENISLNRADGVRLQLQFPLTGQPRPVIRGSASSQDRRCFDDGTVIECVLGRLGPGAVTRVGFEFTSPHATPLGEVRAVAYAADDTNRSNNEAGVPIDLRYYPQPVSGPVSAVIKGCNGRGLNTFFECSAGSTFIYSYTLSLEANGSISLTNPNYSGLWFQSSAEDLHLEYVAQGTIVMSFDGKGVGQNCFEGLATFNSPYNAAYRVCL